MAHKDYNERKLWKPLFLAIQKWDCRWRGNVTKVVSRVGGCLFIWFDNCEVEFKIQRCL